MARPSPRSTRVCSYSMLNSGVWWKGAFTASFLICGFFTDLMAMGVLRSSTFNPMGDFSRIVLPKADTEIVGRPFWPSSNVAWILLSGDFTMTVLAAIVAGINAAEITMRVLSNFMMKIGS